MKSQDTSSTYVDLPVKKFPFTVQFINTIHEVIHEIEVSGPGALDVPALAIDHGPVSVRILYADGTSESSP